MRDYLPDDLIGVRVERDDDRRVEYVEVFDTTHQAVPDTVILDPGHRLRRGTGYEITSFVRSATPEELRATDRNYPLWVRSQYARLPDDFPRRIADEARAQAIIYLEPRGCSLRTVGIRPVPDLGRAPPTTLPKRSRIPPGPRGRLQVEDTPPGRDTIEHFLFESKRGYFDYHASAMVVMLRALDIPARLAVGYVVDEEDYDSETKSYVVRDKNTYAWPEVYFPGYGWVMFNPTPDRPENLYPQAGASTLPLDGQIDLSDFGDLPVGADPLFDVGRQDIDVSSDPASIPSAGSGNPATSWMLPALLAFAALLAMAVGLGWRRAVAGLPFEQQTWEKVVRLSSLAGHPLEPGQTPAEYANGLQKVFRGLRGVSVIASAYNRSRFGRRDASVEERQRIGDLWPPIRGELLRAIAGRILRRGGQPRHTTLTRPR
jgi:hypothetical protein